MGFVNRELKENERREYVLKEKAKDYKYCNYIAKFDSGTIDNENDVRMFIYGDAMKSYENPFWDMNDFHTKYGILDYKGEVIYFTAEVYSNDGNLSWYVKEFDTDEKIDEKEEFLVKALEVYKAEGYPELWSIIDKENPDQRTTNRYVKSVVVYFEI